jgi:hypothetical protein
MNATARKRKIFICFLLFVFNSYVNAQIDIDLLGILYPEKILTITFNNNDRIKSAYYHLESAKSNFKIFESEFAQFNPLIVSPRYSKNSRGDQSTYLNAGMQKEFFNGSFVNTSVGLSRIREDKEDFGAVKIVEAEVGVPLFSSSRTLERVINRTFEENELYTANLEYVEAVRENIRHSLQQYYDIVPEIKVHELLKSYRLDLQKILSDSIRINKEAVEQIEGEITSLCSEITGVEISLYALKLQMQTFMNVQQVSLSQLSKLTIDFENTHYFGKSYIQESSDSIFQQALDNDTEFKVLGVIKKNAEEKKRLAEKGTWDIFATMGGRYSFKNLSKGGGQNELLMADVGLNIKLNDRKILEHTKTKAQADIDAIEFTIIDRRKVIRSEILQLKDALTKKKDQLSSSKSSLNSWEKIYRLKKEQLVSGSEDIEDFIQAFRSLVEKAQTYYELENDYMNLVGDLDFVCGKYFTIINLQA